MKRPIALLTGIAVAAGALALGVASPADAATSGTTRASAIRLLDGLSVRTPSHTGSYRRSAFKLWTDADGDGRNTRAEVLRAESRTRVTANGSGTVKTGRWVSKYDGKTFTVASKLDIDHMVPLDEAWQSGAYAWSARKREAYANDLGYGYSLIAVSKQQNRSKGDRDPASWMPSKASFACTYVKEYIAVKARWRLSVDRAERSALSSALVLCSNVTIAKAGTPVLAKLLPASTPERATSTASKPSGGGSSSGSAYYQNCTAVRAAGKAPLHRDDPGYETPRLDRDGDGTACE